MYHPTIQVKHAWTYIQDHVWQSLVYTLLVIALLVKFFSVYCSTKRNRRGYEEPPTANRPSIQDQGAHEDMGGQGSVTKQNRGEYGWPLDKDGRLVISDGATSIGKGAFEDCAGLKSITIPDSITSIGDRAFNGCAALASITIPDGVTSIGKGAFARCAGLTSITISDSVIPIGEQAFRDCPRLTTITIPDSVTSIRKQAFSRCTALTSITIPDSVLSAGVRNVFSECAGLTSITIPDSGHVHRQGSLFQMCWSDVHHNPRQHHVHRRPCL